MVVPSCPMLSSMNTTTLTTKDNNSSLHNNGWPKLSCVVVNEHDNIDNQRTTIHHSIIMVVPSCPVLSLMNTTTLTTKDNISSLLIIRLSQVVLRCRQKNTTTLTTKDNNSSLLNYGCPKLSYVVVIKKRDGLSVEVTPKSWTLN